MGELPKKNVNQELCIFPGAPAPAVWQSTRLPGGFVSTSSRAAARTTDRARKLCAGGGAPPSKRQRLEDAEAAATEEAEEEEAVVLAPTRRADGRRAALDLGAFAAFQREAASGGE